MCKQIPGSDWETNIRIIIKKSGVTALFYCSPLKWSEARGAKLSFSSYDEITNLTSDPTQSSIDRQAGKYQVDEQRENILRAAETLFLRDGLVNTSMVDIDNQARITRATLYRYFSSRDEIAEQIQIRMIEKIRATLPEDPKQLTLEKHWRTAQLVIRNFAKLRDAYRYIGMFDKIYLDNAPDSTLAQWTKAQLVSGGFKTSRPESQAGQSRHPKELGVILNTIT